MMEIIKIICYCTSILSIVGLLIMNRYFIQERKNNIQKIEHISDKIRNIDQKSESYYSLSYKSLENYKLFLSKDLSGWINLIQEQKSEFKKFEDYYIRHQSKIAEEIQLFSIIINERLEKLEKSQKND